MSISMDRSSLWSAFTSRPGSVCSHLLYFLTLRMAFAHLLPYLENLSSKVLSLGMVKEMTWTIWCSEEDISSVQRQADSLWDEYSE